jgi:hypothetical protein
MLASRRLLHHTSWLLPLPYPHYYDQHIAAWFDLVYYCLLTLQRPAPAGPEHVVPGGQLQPEVWQSSSSLHPACVSEPRHGARKKCQLRAAQDGLAALWSLQAYIPPRPDCFLSKPSCTAELWTGQLPAATLCAAGEGGQDQVILTWQRAEPLGPMHTGVASGQKHPLEQSWAALQTLAGSCTTE